MDKSVATRKLENARRNLESVRASYERALQAQSFQMQTGEDNRSVRNANVAHLFSQLQYWQQEVDRLESIVEGKGGYGSFRVGISL